MGKWILGVLGTIVLLVIGGVVVYWLTEGVDSSRHVPLPTLPRTELPYAGTSMEGCGYGWGYPEQCEEMATSDGSSTPTEQEKAFSRVDRILKSMKWGSIAFNAPSSMNLEESAQIHLLLSLDQSVEDLRDMVTAAGEKEGVRIQVADRMEARLSGQNFQITAITPEEQAITSSGITEWNWEVRPKSAGQHHLHLTLTALFNVDIDHARRAVRTFDKTIEVYITWTQSASVFLGENWQWLWTALLVPVAGWFWKKHNSRVAHNQTKDA